MSKNKIKIIKELNPICEIFGLLCTVDHEDKIKSSTMDSLHDIGIYDDEKVLKMYGLIDKYVSAFKKNMVHVEGEKFFFGDLEDELSDIVTMFLLENPEVIKSRKKLNKTKIRKDFIEFLLLMYLEDNIEIPSSIDETITLISTIELKESTKWKLIAIINDPVKWFENLIEIYESNINAYESALKQRGKQIDKAISGVPDFLDDNIEKIIKEFNEKAKIYVSLITPFSTLVIDKVGIYGIFSEFIMDSITGKKNTNASILVQLKAISDKSKFEILGLLKKKPMYNLEIAEALEITPATASHHMSLLLSNDLVSIEKRDSKVYYHINESTIKSLLNDVENHLLKQ